MTSELPAPPEKFLVRVKTNAKQNKIVSYEEGLLLVEIRATPENNKANIALTKFLSKELQAQVRIKSGFTNKEKILVFL